MTIDEAIKHCEEVAEKQDRKAKGRWIDNSEGRKRQQECIECAADHRQLAEWLTNYKEAIRLLKLAVDDIARTESCFLCKYYDVPDENCRTTDDCFVWRYADEAEKLIGGSENG